MATSASATQHLPPSQDTASYPQAKSWHDIIPAMEKMKKSNECEPTLTDVLEAVQGGFQKMEERFEKVDERFDGVDERFASNDAAHTSLFEIQKQTLELLNERTTTIDTRLSKVQNRVEDIVDVLEKASKKVPSFDVTQLLYDDK